MALRILRNISRFGMLSFLFLIALFFPGAGLPAASTPYEQFEQGVLLYKKGEYSQALKIFQSLEEVSKEPPFAADLALMQGQVLRGLQNWPEAAQAFSRAAESHPLLADYALFFQGESLQKMGEGERSLAVFRRLFDLYPQSLVITQARLRTAEIYFQSGDFQNAAEV